MSIIIEKNLPIIGRSNNKHDDLQVLNCLKQAIKSLEKNSLSKVFPGCSLLLDHLGKLIDSNGRGITVKLRRYEKFKTVHTKQ
jgi:hypothetical protein